MLNNNIIKFLGLKDVVVKRVEQTKDSIFIQMRLKKEKPNLCQYCGCSKLHYHDRRIQKVRDIPYNHKPVFFLVERVRYLCPECRKKLIRKPEFLIRRSQITTRLYHWILKEYGRVKSTNDIAKECGLSVTTLFRIIDPIHPKRLHLPEVLCIDEFKGNSGKEKYQVNLADGKNHKIIDILPTRFQEDLRKYFVKIPKEERSNVQYFVSDMSNVFKAIQDEFFQNSTLVVDKFHFVRQVYWAMERVRKNEQKKMSLKEKLFFKRSKSLLRKPMKKLKDEEMIRLADMLKRNENIREAYYLKEFFHNEVLTQPDSKSAHKTLTKWMDEVSEFEGKEWNDCLRAFKNWKKEILNSFDCPWTNGFVEGSHNRIKTIKRVSFGMPNFHHFRTKILFTFQ